MSKERKKRNRKRNRSRDRDKVKKPMNQICDSVIQSEHTRSVLIIMCCNGYNPASWVEDLPNFGIVLPDGSAS